MKLKNKILPLLLLASTAVGCTDGFERNNPEANKLYEENQSVPVQHCVGADSGSLLAGLHFLYGGFHGKQ